MNFQQLKYALEIYRCQSINKASQSLFVTQPALSLAMKDLEEDLGFTIFERSPRGIHPTPEGTAFLQATSSVVLQIDELVARFSQNSSIPLPAVFRLSSSRYSFVTSAALEFYDKYFEALPHFSIHLDEVDCHQAIQDIFSCKSDLGIIHTVECEGTSALEKVSARGIESELLFTSRSYVTFKKGHPLENMEKVTTYDFLKYPQVRITSREIDFYNNDTAFNFPRYGNSEKNIFTNSRTQLYDFLSKSDAVFFGMTNLAIPDFHPNLITVPVSNDPTNYNIYAIYLKSHHPNLYARNFIDILKKQVQENKNSGV